MSTYAGVSNNTSYNSTIGSNDVYYTAGRHGVYQKDTWWQQTIDALDMELLVNNSWSGSCVFQPRKGEASVGYGDRAVNLHNDHTGEEPDVIFVYLGCNDFAYYKDSFGKAGDVDYAAIIQERGDGTFSYATPATACEAYAIMLHKAAHRYPDAEIYCMTSTARRAVDYTGDTYPDAGQPTAYVAELQRVAEYFGCPVVDLENAIAKDVEIFDKYMGDKRAHANALGMDQITRELLSVMLGKEAEICHVTADDGAVAEQAVLLGGSYHAEVNISQGHSVVVTMEGNDITAGAYQDGRIAIAEVTGDIHVKTVINRDPQNFRWAFQNGTLTSVGTSENVLTKLSGTVANNILNDGIFRLNTSVVLKHDLPWSVEWKCAEDWRGVMLTSHKESATKGMTFLSRVNGGQLCFGTYTGSQYDNYGIDISGLNADTHTYRLENRIAADGSNMIWLYVDGEEIGPMNNYFIGSKDQNKTSDWVSGKDFVFSFIGMTGHALRNCWLEYLAVTECDHTYANGTCTGCGATASGELVPVKNRLYLETEGSVWIDGQEYVVQQADGIRYVDIPDETAKVMTTYTYGTIDGETYPIGMKVWTLENRDGFYSATHQSAFDDLLRYEGCSIRITGKQGIRMITSIDEGNKKALVGAGLAGYTLKEYGTAIAWARQLSDRKPLVLGKSYVNHNFAYSREAGKDPVFDSKDGRMHYTNVLVGFGLNQCSKEIALRPYMILEDAEGNAITIYGGVVERSIHYIASKIQQKNLYAPESEEYKYLQKIIESSSPAK